MAARSASLTALLRFASVGVPSQVLTPVPRVSSPTVVPLVRRRPLVPPVMAVEPMVRPVLIVCQVPSSRRYLVPLGVPVMLSLDSAMLPASMVLVTVAVSPVVMSVPD